MAYKRFKMPTAAPADRGTYPQSVANVATVAGVQAPASVPGDAPSRANATTVKNKLVSYNQAISIHLEPGKTLVCARTPATLATVATLEPVDPKDIAPVSLAAWPPRVLVSKPATLATIATVQPDAYRLAFDTLKAHRPYGATRLQHDQAAWSAEMFLGEWANLAAEFGWPVNDLFNRDGLFWWLGTELIRALGPDHAVTETDRVYDRLTHTGWINPYGTALPN